jgi:hypothetical protein
VEVCAAPQLPIYDIANSNITNAAFLEAVGLNWQVAGFGDFNVAQDMSVARHGRHF